MRDNKTKIVMVFGTFDYLHAGHENLFIQAKEHGTHIVAIIARDRTVKTIKSHLPDHNEKERLKNLEATGWADKVVLGNQKDKTKVIRDFKPHTIALGYDQFAFTYALEKHLIDIKLDSKIVRLKPYRPDMYKSSIVKKQLCYNQEHETISSI
jgi:FAD synthetase